jgi:hypothetical protein
MTIANLKTLATITIITFSLAARKTNRVPPAGPDNSTPFENRTFAGFLEKCNGPGNRPSPPGRADS